MKKILPLVLAIVLFSACKKSKNTEPVIDPPVTVSPAEIQRKADSSFNSKLVAGLGNIYQRASYAVSQENIPVYKIMQGKDTIYYYGKTDATGTVTQLNGYRLTTSTGQIIRLELNRNDSSIVFHDQYTDTSKSIIALEIKHKSDSIISMSLYRVGSGVKTLIYERLKKNTGSLFRKVDPGPTAHPVHKTIKDLFKDAGDWTSALLNKVEFIQLMDEIKYNVQNGTTPLTSAEVYKLNEIFDGSVSATRYLTLAEYYQKLAESKTTDGDVSDAVRSLDDNFWRWFYRARSFNFSFVDVGGFDQTVTYGKAPRPFKAILNYEGVPFVHAKVKVKQVYRGKTKEVDLTTDNFGMLSYTPDAVDVTDDQYGPGKMEVVFEKYNDGSKTTFTVNLKPRLRVHLEYIYGDNQEAEIGQPLPQPLIVRVEDEEGHPAPGVKVYWEDLTPGIASSGFGAIAGITESGQDGRTSISWVMKTTEGTHLAKANFVHISTDDFVMEDGAKVFFTAFARKPLDTIAVMTTGTWKLVSVSGTGWPLMESTGGYTLTCGVQTYNGIATNLHAATMVFTTTNYAYTSVNTNIRKTYQPTAQGSCVLVDYQNSTTNVNTNNSTISPENRKVYRTYNGQAIMPWDIIELTETSLTLSHPGSYTISFVKQ